MLALLSLPSPPSPVIFEAGPFALRYYGLFIALGIAAATWLTAKELGQPTGDQGDQENAPQQTPDKQVAPKKGLQESDGGVAAVEPPSDDMMKLTIPKMKRIKNDKIPTGLGTDETLLHDYAAVHLKATGYPWEKEANVYIAGHRLGYENTNCYLAFWDLNKREEGDEFYITDSEDRKYTYEVFRKFVAGPENLSVLPRGG